ncbi:MAG TPA: hypothetical protein VK355_10205 [Candidatus Binatia bacterium]|nr:hypothetical protein [Candidatus Binatia bacterium]
MRVVYVVKLRALSSAAVPNGEFSLGHSRMLLAGIQAKYGLDRQ